MQHPFSALAPEYAALLSAMRIDPGKVHPLNARAGQILELANKHRDEWADVEGRTGVPRLWGIASFERESSSNYSRSPAQGDRWDRVSKNVPKGRGPFKSWGEACVDAYRIDHLDKAGPDGWTWKWACYAGEAFNGFGPRAHGIHTGYLWAWTNLYDRGKYIADNRWSAKQKDAQCGMIPMMQAILRLDGTLSLADRFPAAAAAPVIPPLAVAVFAKSPAARLQEALNRAGASLPISVDGSYGRETRRAVIAFQEARGLEADGIAGPLTWAAIDA